MGKILHNVRKKINSVEKNTHNKKQKRRYRTKEEDSKIWHEICTYINMETNKKLPEDVQGATQGKQTEDKRNNINYKVSTIIANVKAIKDADLLSEEESKTMLELAQTAVKRHISRAYGLDL